MEIPLEKVEVRERNEEINIENIKTYQEVILRKMGEVLFLAETEFILT